MFYYPLSSCCFVLWGSRSEAVWTEEQRHKAQHRAARLVLPGPFCPTAPAPKGAFGVLVPAEVGQSRAVLPAPLAPSGPTAQEQGGGCGGRRCPGKRTCCFMIFIRHPIVGAVSGSPPGGGAGPFSMGAGVGPHPAAPSAPAAEPDSA